MVCDPSYYIGNSRLIMIRYIYETVIIGTTLCIFLALFGLATGKIQLHCNKIPGKDKCYFKWVD